MDWYKHYIGDFQRDTAHLSLTERGAYRAMLDHHYAKERPLPPRAPEVYRLVGAFDEHEQGAVDRILSEFFHLTENGYVNHRAEREIANCNERRDQNRENGRRGGRPRGSSKKPNGFSFGSGSVSGSDNQSDADPKEVIWGAGVRLLVKAGEDESKARSFLGRLAKHDEDRLCSAILYCSSHPKVDPKTYLAGAAGPKQRKVAI